MLTRFYARMSCPRLLYFRKARAKSKASSLDITSLPTDYKSSELEPTSFQLESALPAEPQFAESMVEETEEKEESESQ